MSRYKINRTMDALIEGPKRVIIGGKVTETTDQILASMGYLPLSELPKPDLKEGETLIVKYEYVTEEVTREPPEGSPRRKPRTYTRRVAIKPVYEVKPAPPEPVPTYTYSDYDNAMEDYIRQVRIERGYTLREPSDYVNDPYPRFAQDAKDFILFRSLCMQYALPILNKYKETGEAPTMEEFKAGFPKCQWTYKEEM